MSDSAEGASGRQVVLLTGSSTGFGRASAERLAREGHRVAATMRAVGGSNAQHAARLRAMAERDGLDLVVEELDVTEDDSVRRGVDRVLERFGALDVVVNNAGIWGPGVLEAFPLPQWREVFEVNLFGSVRVARAVLPHLRGAGRGLLVQICSLQGRFVLPYSGPYVASKFAVEAMAETFSYELAPFGVEVTIVEPYDFRTEMKDKARLHVAEDRAVTAAYGVEDFVEQAYLTPSPERSGDPAVVVDAIAGLVRAPSGSRPRRLTVSNPLPQIDRINALTDEMHARLYPSIGLGGLVRDRPNQAVAPPPG